METPQLAPQQPPPARFVKDVTFTVALVNMEEVKVSFKIGYNTDGELFNAVKTISQQVAVTGVTIPQSDSKFVHYPAHRILRVDVEVSRLDLVSPADVRGKLHV